MALKSDGHTTFLSTAEYNALERLQGDKDFFNSLEQEFSIRVSKAERSSICRALIECAEDLDAQLEVRRDMIAQARSIASLAKPLAQFVAELKRQAALKEDDPSRAGFELVSEFLRDREVLIVGMDDAELKHIEATGQLPEDVQKAEVNLSPKMADYDELLTALLEPMEEPGHLSKIHIRKSIYIDLGEIFARCGGQVGASYKDAKGKPDGPYIRFMLAVIAACPKPLRDYLTPNLAEDVRNWLRFIGWTKLPKNSRPSATEDGLGLELMHVRALLASNPNIELDGRYTDHRYFARKLPENAALITVGEVKEEDVLSLDDVVISEVRRLPKPIADKLKPRNRRSGPKG